MLNILFSHTDKILKAVQFSDWPTPREEISLGCMTPGIIRVRFDAHRYAAAGDFLPRRRLIAELNSHISKFSFIEYSRTQARKEKIRRDSRATTF